MQHFGVNLKAFLSRVYPIRTRQLTSEAKGGAQMLYLKKLRMIIFVAAIFVFLASPSFAASYTVLRNDSLFTVSQLFNTTINRIYSDSKLSSTNIYPGQVLQVPATTYTVKSGDTLYLIAQRYGADKYSLKRANNEWDSYLYIGQKLIIPTGRATSAAVVPYTSSEVDLLARLITAETTGQPYSAQVAVGDVVINRVKYSGFPNTISGVINQVINGYYQFSPVLNGTINQPATATAKSAAYDAIHGVNPVKGALFYFDDSATNTWLWSKPIVARIGRMVFTN